MASPEGGRRRRRADEPERTFQWVVPKGRKASIYEDITLDTQPSVHRFMTGGYMVGFEDGRGTWDDGSTALDATWSAFRDPSELWERPYYQQGAQTEREIDDAVRGARDEGLLEELDPAWLEVLRRDGQVPAFVEHGIWSLVTRRSRAALSDVLTHVLVLYAAMKQRQAQALVVTGMDLDEALGGFAIEDAKARWTQAPEWQPARRCVERLGTITDWGELIVATGLAVEPLLGVGVRRELLLRPALAGADPVTPVVVRHAQREWSWWRALAVEFARFVCADEAHGAENRRLVDGWLASWTADAREAVEALAPLLDGVPGGDATAALGRLEAERAALVAEAGLAEAVPA
ncbi:hypothetical protein [Conexibacter sp. SYSU D00693]|uniref:hypothetical protein n=1 Tax=Conexibacter sp. SYSU D00693 TaxID=2812560 RepID=UPI00196AB522|nr:hypothetical protein [Conexibacter sp. SYSU D00693]